MIWKIAKKDFLLNLMTFKFAVGTILCVVLMTVFMPVLVNDYQQRLKDYNENVAADEAELRKVKVYKNITPTIYRPPNPLSVFSQGLQKRFGNSAKIELDRIPEITAAAAKGNPYLSIYSVFDASLIFKIVISVLALLVAYDVISGEREQGTLKLIMSGEVARYQVLLSKLLAGLMTLAVPVTTAFIVGLLIILSFSMIDLTASDWARIGMMHLASLIFIAAMYNIGLLFSCLARRSAISLVLGLFLWIVFVVVIPNGSGYLARKIQPLEPEEKIEGQRKLVAERYKNERREMIRGKYPIKFMSHSERSAFGHNYILVCDSRSIENYSKSYAIRASLEIKYADKLWEIEHGYLASQLKQKYFANNLARTSPICLYENLISALAGTDLANSKCFMDKVKMHRSSVIDYIRSKTDNFSSLSYFTRSKEEDWEVADRQIQGGNMENIVWEEFHKWREKKIKEKIPSLDLQDFPKFIYKPGIMDNFKRAIFDLMLLVVINVVFFALSFVAFVRYDVRSD